MRIAATGHAIDPAADDGIAAVGGGSRSGLGHKPVPVDFDPFAAKDSDASDAGIRQRPSSRALGGAKDAAVIEELRFAPRRKGRRVLARVKIKF